MGEVVQGSSSGQGINWVHLFH